MGNTNLSHRAGGRAGGAGDRGRGAGAGGIGRRQARAVQPRTLQMCGEDVWSLGHKGATADLCGPGLLQYAWRSGDEVARRRGRTQGLVKGLGPLEGQLLGSGGPGPRGSLSLPLWCEDSNP